VNHALSDICRFFRAAERMREPLVLASVLRTDGSTYSKAGARVLIAADGRTSGMISGGCLESDLRERALRVLARKLINTPAEASDDSIANYIQSEINHAHWAPRSGLRITVEGKIVHLNGTVFSDEERQGVICIAENAPGVKDVQDNLVFVDPGSGMAFPAGG